VTILNDVACSEDMDWFAFPAAWSRDRVARWLLGELDWWWLHDSMFTWTDDDCLHGWVTAYRDLLERIQRAHVRLADPVDESPDPDVDWWLPADASHPDAQPAWVVEPRRHRHRPRRT